MDQSVQLNLDHGGVRRSVTIGRRVRRGCCSSPSLFNLHSECLTKGAVATLGDFIMGGQVVGTVQYTSDLVVLVREETVLQGMIESLIRSGQCCEMEINVETN